VTENWFELAIIAFIIAGIAVAVWKGGQANPEGTGSLGRKFTRLEKDFSTMRGDVRKIERQVEDIERRSAKISDIERLERLVAEQGRHITEQNVRLVEVGETVAAIREAGDQRGKQLDMIFQQIITKGMNA
jgi:hypothetical protein